MKIVILTFTFLSLLACNSTVDFQVTSEEKVNTKRALSAVSIDRNFANNGSFTWDANNGSTDGKEHVTSLTSDSNGNIYLAGYLSDSDNDMNAAIWKLKSNGELDTSFATGGVFIYDNANRDDEFYDIKIDSSNNIYVAGYSEDGSGYADVIVFKLNTNGAQAASFGSAGLYRYTDPDAGSSEGERGRCLILTDNNVYVVGQGEFESNDKTIKVWALDMTGSLDASFGSSGIYALNSPTGSGGSDKGFGCDIDSQGSILVSGITWGGGSFGHEGFVLKVTANGSLDTSFATSGVYIVSNLAGGTGTDYLPAVTVDSNDNIYVVGESYAADSTYNAIVVKLDSSGALDTSFANSGVYEIAQDFNVFFRDVEVHNDKLYISGHDNDSGFNSFVLSLSLDGEVNPDFYDNGLFFLEHLFANNKERAIGLDVYEDNSIIVSGNVLTGASQDVMVFKIK